MVSARARWVATTLGVMALAAIIVSRQSEGDWRGSSDKVTLAQDRYAEARGEMNARGPAINKLLEHSVELETRLANQEKAERQMADAVQAAQRKVDALKAKDAKLHMVIGWPQRGGAMPTTYPAFGGLPSQEDGAVQADGDFSSVTDVSVVGTLAESGINVRGPTATLTQFASSPTSSFLFNFSNALLFDAAGVPITSITTSLVLDTPGQAPVPIVARKAEGALVRVDVAEAITGAVTVVVDQSKRRGG